MYSKRGRVDQSAADEADGSQPFTRSEMENLLNERNSEIVASLTSAITKTFQEEQATTLRKYDAIQVKKFEALGNEINGLKQRMSDLEKSQASSWEATSELKSKLAIAEKVVYDPIELDDTWDRQVRREVLCINTAALVAKVTLLESLMPWLNRMGLEDHPWQLDGPSMGKTFELKFKGTPSLGALRARKANQLLKDVSTNQWTTLYTEDAEHAAVQIYIGPDKSPKTKREEQLTKRLLKSFQNKMPNKPFYFNRRECAVCLSGKPLGKIEAASFEDFQTQWVYENLQPAGVDKDPIQNHFKDNSGTAHGVTWSV